MTAVKICGLTRADDVAVAIEAGADYVGVILASGPRLLDATRAKSVLGVRRPNVGRVGVFGAQSVDEIIALTLELDLDVAQLHGGATPDEVARIRSTSGRAVWPVLRVQSVAIPDHALSLASAANFLVLDAQVAGQLGGTGVALDWAGMVEPVRELRRAVPQLSLVLAGGLNALNVTQAIRLLTPDVVDVSSGVETAPGVKDPAAVRRFVTAAHAATGIHK